MPGHTGLFRAPGRGWSAGCRGQTGDFSRPTWGGPTENGDENVPQPGADERSDRRSNRDGPTVNGAA
eukprot:12966300-Alexandrium_andersonii.AAC.1